MSDLWEHIDLTSGIGGFALAFEQANLSKPILFCEIDPFCQKILRKHWKDVPIVNDLKELAHDTTKFIPRRNGRKRILSSGFPCQPWSVARRFGKHKPGKEDPRHLFPYIIDILSQERFECCVFENVPGIIAEGIDDVKNDLETQGYSSTILHCPSGTIIGKPHKRERIFIIAFNLSDTKGFRYRGGNSEKRGNEQWVIQPKEQTRDQVGGEIERCSILPGQKIRQSRMDQHRIDGFSERVARSIDHRDKLYNHKLKALGNSVVVPFVKHIGIAIKDSFNEM
jgi:site-specific DNA-cytosine methylase